MINYKIIQGETLLFHVVMIGKNGEPLNTSETLSSFENAMKNIKAVITGHNPTTGTLFKIFVLHIRMVYFLEVDERGGLTQLNTVRMNKSQLKRFGL